MKTYYPGEILPDGYYWLFCATCEQPWTIDFVLGGKIADHEGKLWPLWEEEPESKAIGPILPPE